MAKSSWESDSLCFANILEELVTLKLKSNETERESALATKVISFKDKFTLNFINLIAGSRACVQGLEEVLGETIFDNKNYLLIVSNEVNSAANGLDNSSDDHVDESELLSEEIFHGTKIKPQYKNYVDIESDLVVKVGPTSASSVQFIAGKSQLQSAGSTSSIKTVKTELLSALTLRDARSMVSLFVQGVIRLKNKLNSDSDFCDLVLPWLLIKCNSEKPQNVSWLCCKMEHTAKDGIKTGILKSFVVADKHPVLDLEEDLKKTLNYESEKCLYFARYDILSSVYKQSDDDAMDRSKLVLELSWSSQTAPFQPPPSAADTLAKFRIVPSAPSSPLSPIYMELIQLESIVNGSAGSSDEIWLEVLSQKDTLKSIVDTLPDFLESLKTLNYADVDDSDKNESMDKSPLASYVLDNLRRKDHDFTDDLWEFLKDAVSFDDIMQCLDFIFAAICTREIQPVFNSENKTDLAQWIREFYRAANQNEGREILKERFDTLLEKKANVWELFANLGLEKFKRDYISFFVNKELATFGQLESILANEGSLTDRMFTIWKLHHSLELVAVSIVHLHLPIDYLRMVLKASLDYFKDTENLINMPVFSVSIPAVSTGAGVVIDRCAAMKPVLWKCSANVNSERNGRGPVKMFISTEDRGADYDFDSSSEDDIGVPMLHKTVAVTESSVRVY